MKKLPFLLRQWIKFQVIAEQFPVEFIFQTIVMPIVLERADKLGVKRYAFELRNFDN